MNANKHITGIKGLEHFDAAIIKAHQSPRKLAKVQAGWYLVDLDGELVEIMQNGENGWWSAHQIDHRWVSDAMPTLKEMKDSFSL